MILLDVLTCRGVLNIVHGMHDTVNRILDHPDIAAVSFVGGDKAGRYIYERAAANGKRVQVCRACWPCGRLAGLACKTAAVGCHCTQHGPACSYCFAESAQTLCHI